MRLEQCAARTTYMEWKDQLMGSVRWPRDAQSVRNSPDALSKTAMTLTCLPDLRDRLRDMVRYTERMCYRGRGRTSIWGVAIKVRMKQEGIGECCCSS